MKKSESNDESEENEVTMEKFSNALSYILSLKEYCNDLEERIRALERVMIDVKHTNTDDGSRHRNDGGWFD